MDYWLCSLIIRNTKLGTFREERENLDEAMIKGSIYSTVRSSSMNCERRIPTSYQKGYRRNRVLKEQLGLSQNKTAKKLFGEKLI